MKKLIYGTLFLAAVGIGFVACEKQEAQEISEESIEEQDAVITQKSQSGDPVEALANDLTNLNTYLFNCESQSSGNFFNYWLSNPNSTLNELEGQGFLIESEMLGMFAAIEASADLVDDEDVVWEQIIQNVDPFFVDIGNGGGGPNGPSGIIIFRCDNCMDGIKGNAVYTSFIWSWGPGCC